jgi:hypothetical protein
MTREEWNALMSGTIGVHVYNVVAGHVENELLSAGRAVTTVGLLNALYPASWVQTHYDVTVRVQILYVARGLAKRRFIRFRSMPGNREMWRHPMTEVSNDNTRAA